MFFTRPVGVWNFLFQISYKKKFWDKEFVATVKVYSEELDEAAYRDGMKATEFNWNKYTDLQQNLYFLKNNFRPVFGFPFQPIGRDDIWSLQYDEMKRSQLKNSQMILNLTDWLIYSSKIWKAGMLDQNFRENDWSFDSVCWKTRVEGKFWNSFP